mgnify:CR=1 FL=1
MANTLFYLLDRETDVAIWGEKVATLGHRYNLEGTMTTVEKTTTDRKASQKGLTDLLTNCYVMTLEERIALYESEGWKATEYLDELE